MPASYPASSPLVLDKKSTAISGDGWPRAVWLGLSLTTLLVSSIVAFRQSPRSPADQAAASGNTLGRLLYPVEENPPLQRIETDLSAVYALDEQRIWAVGNLGLIMHSEDGGRTWTQQRVTTDSPPPPAPSPQASASPEDLAAIIFANAQYGWIAGRNGTLYSTEDGGQHWYARAIKMPSGSTPAESGAVSFRTEKGWYELTDGGDLQLTSSPYINESAQFYQHTVEFTYDGDLKIDDYKIRVLATASADNWQSIVGGDGIIYLDTPQTGWIAASSGTNQNLRAARLIGSWPGVGWVVGDGGTIIHSSDGGRTWKPQTSHVQGRLNDVYFLPDGRHGWAVGYNGILATGDGGEHWVRAAVGPHEEPSTGAYSVSLPRWYFLSWPLAGLLLLPALRRRGDVTPPDESVADILVSDRPLEAGDPDPLEFQTIALGLSRFLRNEKTVPPLTIAITGEWGTGKSSLMNLLRADLREYGYRPVWFNAWHHQKEEHLLASLLQNVRLQAIPHIWRPVGLMFRARLLLIRGWRHWLPVLLLLFIAALLTGYAFARFKAGISATGSTDAFITYFFNFKPGDLSQSAPRLALLASLASVILATWKGVTAFGVNPASLLATVSRGMRLRDLDAQTSFRKKFADEFNDVTRALGQRSMIIFIDDLDRCRPENVLDTLEAVNFLVSSGDCFVVIGMARERVERCVGLSFKDVAEEVLDSAVGAGEPSGGAASNEARRKRAEFARQYLDKLINIEVPVPVPTAEQSRELLIASNASPLPELLRRCQQARTIAMRIWPVAVASLILSAGVYTGSRMHERFHDSSGEKPNVTTTTTTTTPGNALPTTAAPDASLAKTQGNEVRRPDKNSTSSPTPDEAELRKQTQAASLTTATPARRPLVSYWPLPLGVLALLVVAGLLLTRRPDLVVKDSEEFEAALRIWHPLVFSRHKTPRSLKRFMNRVRYLAMRQRPQQESQSRWERAVAQIARRFGIELHAAMLGGDSSQKSMPESALVALAAIQQFAPGWLENKQHFQQWIIHNIVPATHDVDELALLREAKNAHEEKFDYWPSIEKHRAAFLKMSADIRVN
ncbi:MAG TPA: P-loop NTPase fold protein [Pyrinomonadaceae bacterium]|nr:P-loop NTPase fold protein [Pyrinomonadaceae bacterium]